MELKMNPEIRKVITVECMLAEPPRTIHLKYVDRKGQEKDRHVEPYEIKDGQLFGYCLADNHIKRFILIQIRSARAGEPFRPRQPIVLPL